MGSARKSHFTVTQLKRLDEAIHFAEKHEQRVWGSGSEHEAIRAEIERLEGLRCELLIVMSAEKIAF
jgi:hypothetical protein